MLLKPIQSPIGSWFKEASAHWESNTMRMTISFMGNKQSINNESWQGRKSNY